MNNELKCGCGGKINTAFYDGWHFCCDICEADMLLSPALSESEAIEAFKKATKADKQGIQWINVKDRLPEKEGQYLIIWKGVWQKATWNQDYQEWDDSYGDDYLCPATSPTHWAEINLPENEE